MVISGGPHARSVDEDGQSFRLPVFKTEELFDGRGMEIISYRAFGNDGSHTFGESITTGTGAPRNVLETLVEASNHLPVVADYAPAPIDDSTRDDVFDSSDLLAVFQAGQYEDDVADNSDWKAGDWNGDRDFEAPDSTGSLRGGLEC